MEEIIKSITNFSSLVVFINLFYIISNIALYILLVITCIFVIRKCKLDIKNHEKMHNETIQSDIKKYKEDTPYKEYLISKDKK